MGGWIRHISYFNSNLNKHTPGNSAGALLVMVSSRDLELKGCKCDQPNVLGDNKKVTTSESPEPRSKKKPPTFHHTGWSIRILIMFLLNPYITG